MGACELFGFGLGTFSDKLVAAARMNANNAIPWLLENDWSLLVHLDNGRKVLRCFAQVAFWVTQTNGVTELTVTDHNVTRKLQAHLDLFQIKRLRLLLIKYSTQSRDIKPFHS